MMDAVCRQLTLQLCNQHQCVTTDRARCDQCMLAVTDDNLFYRLTLHWSADAWLRWPLQHRSRRSSRLILSLAIRISPSGPTDVGICSLSSTCADLFIYTYYMQTAWHRRRRGCCCCWWWYSSKCAWIFQWDLRKRWRIVAGLMCCVYTLTAWLFSDAHDALCNMRRPCRICCVSLSVSLQSAAVVELTQKCCFIYCMERARHYQERRSVCNMFAFGVKNI